MHLVFCRNLLKYGLMDASDDILIDPTGRNRALYEFRSNKIHMKYNSCIAFGTDESLGYIEIDEVYTHIKSYNFKIVLTNL